MNVDIIPIPNSEIRNGGFCKIDLNMLPLPSNFSISDQVLISIPPMQFGGNHKHPRREIFLCLSDDVELHWIDNNSQTHIHRMREAQQLYLFHVHPYTPHAIINRSENTAAIILELSDDFLTNVVSHNDLVTSPTKAV